MKYSAFFAATTLAAVCSLQAQYTEIDISSQANSDIQTYTDGFNYQLGGTQLSVGSVPFGLAQLNSTAGTTGVVQSPEPGAFDYTFAVPSGTQATALYSLANTAFGAFGTLEGSLVVTGTLGETATLNLVEGDNIRDHNNDGYVNTLSDSSVVPTYFQNGSPTTDGDIQTRLDMQTLNLPSTFAGDTIATIDFEGFGNGNPVGSAFLAGLTLSDAPVSSVPDAPLPLPLTAGVLLALFGIARIKQLNLAR